MLLVYVGLLFNVFTLSIFWYLWFASTKQWFFIFIFGNCIVVSIDNSNVKLEYCLQNVSWVSYNMKESLIV